VKRDAVELSSSSSSSSSAFFSSAAVHYHETFRTNAAQKQLAFLVDKLDESSDKLDYSIGLRRAFLHRQHASQHLQNHLFKDTLSN
jgi:hypothetical protein